MCVCVERRNTECVVRFWRRQMIGHNYVQRRKKRRPSPIVFFPAGERGKRRRRRRKNTHERVRRRCVQYTVKARRTRVCNSSSLSLTRRKEGAQREAVTALVQFIGGRGRPREECNHNYHKGGNPITNPFAQEERLLQRANNFSLSRLSGRHVYRQGHKSRHCGRRVSFLLFFCFCFSVVKLLPD